MVLLLFLAVLQDVLTRESLVIADQAVYHFLQSLRTPWPDHILVAVSELGDSFVNVSLCLAILIGRSLAGTLQWRLFVFVFVISFCIALSRLYLGAHWLSDVMGGFLIGTSWTALLGLAYLKGQTEIIPRRLLELIVMLVLVGAGGWHVRQLHEKDLALYAPRNTIQSMPLVTWLAQGWRELPGWRIDMEGAEEQPLTIQLAGSPDQLAQYLLFKGWQRPPPLKAKVILGMLSPDTKLEDLPVLPRLHDGRFDSMLLVREVDGQRWVLRMWPTDMMIMKNDTPLFVGTIEVQKRRHTAGLITSAENTGETAVSLAALQETLLDRFAEKQVSRSCHEFQVNHKDRPVDTTRSVLLIWDKRGLAGKS